MYNILLLFSCNIDLAYMVIWWMSIFFRLDWVTLTLSQIQANIKNCTVCFRSGGGMFCIIWVPIYLLRSLSIETFCQIHHIIMKKIFRLWRYIGNLRNVRGRLKKQKVSMLQYLIFLGLSTRCSQTFCIGRHDSFAKREWRWPWYGRDDSFRTGVSL